MRYLLALPLLIVSGIPAEAQNGIMHQNLGGTYDYGTGQTWTARVFILLQAARHGQKTPVSALPEQDTTAPMTVTIPINAQRNNNKTRRAMSAFAT
jgi:hypothetical protein